MTLDSKQLQRFAILDRDGTIIEERNYLSDPDQVKLIPGAAEALRGMREDGLGLTVVTNQSGVARGYFDLARLYEINQRMYQLLEIEGVYLDSIYFCPHTPDDACNCRKPKPGMIEQAAKELNFDPTQCLVVGDRETDIELGQNVGATTFLVATGYGAETNSKQLAQPDYLVNDLLEASQVMRTLVLKNKNSVNPSKLS